MKIFNKTLSFIKRDFRIDTSYQLQFIMWSVNSFVFLFLFYYISKLVNTGSTGMQKYDSDYFSYVLIGYAFYQYFQMILSSFASSIQREQVTGCLETMLSTQTQPQTCIFLSSFYIIIYSTLQLAIIFILGSVFFRFDISKINIISSIVVFFLSVFTFISFGIISAAFIIVLKKGDPLGWLITSSNFILGGAFFPVDVMPFWIRQFSKFIPATYTLDALRLSILKGYSCSMLISQISILGLMFAVLFPISIRLLLLAVKKAKKDGTLVQY